MKCCIMVGLLTLRPRVASDTSRRPCISYVIRLFLSGVSLSLVVKVSVLAVLSLERLLL